MTPSADSLPAAPTTVFRPASWVDPLPLAELFPHLQPLEVELGSGDGSFLARWAESHPGRNFVGVERLLGRLRKLDRKARRQGLRNLRLLRIEAAYFLRYLLPPASVEAIHLYFPDPWPKRRHRAHRLVNAAFAEAAARALVPGGIVYLRTDDEAYFQQILEVFAAAPVFRPVETQAALATVVPDFERGFNAQGIPTRRAAYLLGAT